MSTLVFNYVTHSFLPDANHPGSPLSAREVVIDYDLRVVWRPDLGAGRVVPRVGPRVDIDDFSAAEQQAQRGELEMKGQTHGTIQRARTHRSRLFLKSNPASLSAMTCCASTRTQRHHHGRSQQPRHCTHLKVRAAVARAGLRFPVIKRQVVRLWEQAL
jgi:hypothetical protein